MNVISLDEYRARRNQTRASRILVVDDQATVQLILRELLENAGYEVLIAETGEKALEYIAADELVEITPNHIRMRKKLLLEHERKKASRQKTAN